MQRHTTITLCNLVTTYIRPYSHLHIAETPKYLLHNQAEGLSLGQCILYTNSKGTDIAVHVVDLQ